MKKIAYIFLSLAALCSSCSVLDRDPESFWGGGSFFTEEAHLWGTLYGGYDKMQDALGANYLVYGDVRADLFELNDPSKQTMEKALNNSLDINMSLAKWRTFYDIVKQANLVLYHTPILQEAGKVNATNAANLIGQAYCMRAFAYFWIVRIWGDAPLILEPFQDAQDDFNQTRTASADVLASVHSDLENAAKNIPSTSTDRVTFTRTAAYAIQAQVYAWEHNWEQTVAFADLVLKGTSTNPIGNAAYPLAKLYDASLNTASSSFMTSDLLNTEYVQMFNKGQSKESIFELAYINADGDSNNSLFMYLSDTYPQLKPRTGFSDEYPLYDWRIYSNFYTSPSGKCMKFFIGYVKNNSERNIIFLRVSETALLKAEALLNQVPEPDFAEPESKCKAAMDLVNAIRTRAGGVNLEIDPIDYEDKTLDELKEIVAQERKLELAFEGHRYFDLVRTGKVFEVMEPINGQNDPRSVVWPIHLDEIRDSNGLIEQNEYYK